MSALDYLPLLILPVSGLAIMVVVWIILAADKNRGHLRTPAE